MLKTVLEVMNEYGLKRTQIELLIHGQNSKWFKLGGKWLGCQI